jgi:hypothetical protein
MEDQALGEHAARSKAALSTGGVAAILKHACVTLQSMLEQQERLLSLSLFLSLSLSSMLGSRSKACSSSGRER